MLSILLVDDEPSIRLAIGDALTRAGHRVVRANDGVEATEKCTKQVFDLVITDVSMPEMDGMTLLREVRTLSPTTDVVVMTAFSSVPNVVQAFKLGADEYLTKPFTEEELLTRIGTIEERRRLRSPRVIA